MLKKKKIWLPLLAVLLVLAVAAGFLFFKLTVHLSAGFFPARTADLTAVVTAEDLPLLEKFTALETADLSGSGCYEEIYAWGQAHPQVALRYTVPMPGDLVCSSEDQTLTLPLLDAAGLAEAAQRFAYLPALTEVRLPGEAEGLAPEDFLALYEARPDLSYEYRFTVGRQELSVRDTSLSLPELDAAGAKELLPLLPAMKELSSVDLGREAEGRNFGFADLALLQAARPELDFAYRFTLFGKEFSTLDTAMDLNHIPMTDGGAAVREAVACMPRLTVLDMDSCGVSNEDMAAIRDAFPDVEVIWRIWFANNYSVRTNVERILASAPTIGGNVGDGNSEPLKYCTKVKYLDLGHNHLISDISFVSYMPDLEVCILAMNIISDISPLADCPHLEYLELQSNYVEDLTPLSGLQELRHLNVAYYYGLSDISPLYNLTKLERLWLGCLNGVPAEQVAEMQRRAPQCVIDTSVGEDPTAGAWRYDPDEKDGLAKRYALLREQFGGYTRDIYSYSWNDPLY